MNRMLLVLLATTSLFLGCSQESPLNTTQEKGPQTNSSESLALVTVEGDMGYFPTTERNTVLAKNVALLQPDWQLDKIYVPVRTWQSTPVVKYYFDETFPNTKVMTAQHKNEFRRALKDISNGTGISFQEVAQREHVTTLAVRVFDIIPQSVGAAGYSLMGQSVSCGSCFDNGNQFVAFSINNYGMVYSTYVHEVLHTLGFAHEHQRKDIDNNIITVNATTNDYEEWGGDVLSTPYDPASVMHYFVDGLNIELSDAATANHNYQWIGFYSLMSRYDRIGIKKEYLSEPETMNIVRLLNLKTQKYMCFNTSGQIEMLSAATSTGCNLDLSTGTVALESRNGGPVTTYWTSAPRLRHAPPNKTSGYFNYLDIKKNSDGSVIIGTKLQITSEYASSIVPVDNASGSLRDGTVMLWSDMGACLEVNSSNSLVSKTLTESTFRPNHSVKGTHPGCFWKIIPQWDATKAY